MAKKSGHRPRFLGPTKGLSCCKVESVVSVDERGQMVLPKEIREAAGIRPGDKLAVVGWKKGGQICCISLIRVDDLADMVKEMLAPVMKDVLKPEEVKK